MNIVRNKVGSRLNITSQVECKYQKEIIQPVFLFFREPTIIKTEGKVTGIKEQITFTRDVL
jgi:hypothetical protein